MKLTSVELHPENSSAVCVFSFRDPTQQNPYNIKGIIGLDADSIIPRYYGISGATNNNFYDITLEKRDVVLRIGLNPNFSENQTYSDLRDTLYKAISSSRTGMVQLQFKNEDDTVAAISGWITKFESPHFEKTQEVQLTISAQDPMLKAVEAVEVDVADLNASLTNIQDLVSTAPHGMTFDMTFIGDSANFKMTNPYDSSWSFEVAPSAGFLNGDMIHFSSERNAKELYVIKSGVTVYLADALVFGSVWPILFPGDNPFTFENPTSLMWTNLSYFPTYWGV